MLGLAASCGYDELLVRPRPNVTLFVTGDELLRAGVSGDAHLRDALGPMLPTLIERLGGRVTHLRFVADHPGD